MHCSHVAGAAILGTLAALPLCSGCTEEADPNSAGVGALSSTPAGIPAGSQAPEQGTQPSADDQSPPALPAVSVPPGLNAQQPPTPPGSGVPVDTMPTAAVVPADAMPPSDVPAPPAPMPSATPQPSASAAESAAGGQGGQAPVAAGGAGILPQDAGAGGQGGTATMMQPVSPYQSDPGDEGDGVFEQAAPYRAAPETSERLNGAPEGELSGSEAWRSPAVFEDWWFDYRIYVPAQYQDGKPAALLIMQDGTGSYGFLPRVMDNLIHSGDMPVTIGVFIEPGTKKGPGERHADSERSECYDTVSDRYARMLVEEFLPEVLTDYDIVDDPDGWAIGGNSSGGSAAFTAGWFMPDNFRKILTNIGSFTRIAPGKTGKDIGADLYPMYIRETDPPKPLRVTLRSGTKDLDNQYGDWLKANFAMAEALEERGYHYRFVHGTAGHSTEHAKADVVTAMRWLWRGFQLPHYP